MKNVRPFFSLIMPVYNAEKFLDKSIDSVLEQTFKDFELILVDDCSKDDSYEFCNKYALNDNRVKLLKNESNSGASKTRNNGIDQAIGRYIGFVDADDWLELDLLEIVHKELMSTNCDCLKYGVIEEYINADGRITFSKVCKPERVFCKEKDIVNQMIVLEQYPLFGYCYNTFYKKSIITDNALYLDEILKVNEDFDFNIRCFELIKTLSVIDYCGYHYAKRVGNSLSSQKSNYNYDVHMKKVNAFLNLLEDNDKMSRDNLEKVFWMYVRFVYASLENGESFTYIKEQNLFKQFLKVDFKNVGSKQKVMIDVLKTKNKYFVMSFLKIITLVKKSMPIMFAKIKR